MPGAADGPRREHHLSVPFSPGAFARSDMSGLSIFEEAHMRAAAARSFLA